jgi:type IV secretion system protein VirD4
LKKHPNYKHTAEADKKNAFDPASLFGKPLRVKPDDKFTVYPWGEVGKPIMSEGEDILNYDDIGDPDAFA